MQRVAQRETLIEVDHQLYVLADRIPHGANRVEVVVDLLTAEAQLEPGEASLRHERGGLVTEPVHRGQPEPVAVVRGHRAERAAQVHRQRHAGRFRQGVPQRHVDAGHRNETHALQADQGKRSARRLENVDGPHRLSFEGFHEVVDGRNEVARGVLEIGLQIAVPNRPFLGLEVDQDHRPLLEAADFGDDGPPEGNADRSNVGASDRQRVAGHHVVARRSATGSVDVPGSGTH